jgi:hypothetical protein
VTIPSGSSEEAGAAVERLVAERHGHTPLVDGFKGDQRPARSRARLYEAKSRGRNRVVVAGD